jgi:hypothetical protein
MSVNNTNHVKKGKLKMFLLFLFITTFIWFVSKFSKEFTATVEAEINYINVPKGVLISDDNYKNVSFDITANGFDFLFYKIKHPSVSIDLKRFYKDKNRTAEISNSDFTKLITTQFNKSIAVKNISIETMLVKLDRLESKLIPVLFSNKIQFEKGYKSIGGVSIIPDSILISGPLSIIEKVKEISTETITINNLKASIDKTIKLQISNENEISYSQKEVQLTIIVKEFTQKTLIIPVQLINVPSQIELKIIPEKLNITFDISMEKFNTYNENDFSIICDFNKRNDEGSFIIPEFLKKPDSILNVEIQENKVKYLIFK